MTANNIEKVEKMDNLKIVQIIPGTIFFTEFASFTPESNEEEKWLPDMGVPNPSSIEWEGAVSTNMEKNARGDVFLEYVSKKRKVTMNWDFLTQAQYRNLLNHLEVDFNNSEQAVLYYKIKALNPNSANYYTDGDTIQPRLDEMIGYLEGKYVGKVKVYNSPQNVAVNSDGNNTDETVTMEAPLTIGYESVSLVFVER